MKHALTFLVILFISISVNASAQSNESLSSYILEKQSKAAQVKRNTEMKVQHLRSLPKNAAHVENTTPKLVTTETVMARPTVEELEAIAPAAGEEAISHDSNKAAKISTK